MAAGRTGTVTLQTSGRISYGRPTAAATVVARSGTDATIFTLSPGQTQSNGQAAPACRVTFPLWANGPTMFTTDGWALFDAAARLGGVRTAGRALPRRIPSRVRSSTSSWSRSTGSTPTRSPSSAPPARRRSTG